MRPDVVIPGMRNWPMWLAAALMLSGLALSLGFAAEMIAGPGQDGTVDGFSKDMTVGVLGGLGVALLGALPLTIRRPMIRFTAEGLDVAEFLGRRRRVAYRELGRVNWLFARNPKYWRIPLAEGRGRPLMVRFAFLTQSEVAQFKTELALRAAWTTPDAPKGGRGNV